MERNCLWRPRIELHAHFAKQGKRKRKSQCDNLRRRKKSSCRNCCHLTQKKKNLYTSCARCIAVRSNKLVALFSEKQWSFIPFKSNRARKEGRKLGRHGHEIERVQFGRLRCVLLFSHPARGKDFLHAVEKQEKDVEWALETVMYDGGKNTSGAKRTLTRRRSRQYVYLCKRALAGFSQLQGK